MEIDFDLEKFPLEIKTNSELESEEKVRVKFLSGPAQTNAGGITFSFKTVVKCWIWECTGGNHPKFQTSLPAEVNKVWRITLSRNLDHDRRVVVHCNEVEVLSVVLSNSTCGKDGWTLPWSKDVVKIKFEHDDTASDLYRPEPGMQIFI